MGYIQFIEQKLVYTQQTNSYIYINVCQLSKKPPFTIEVCGKMSNRFEGNVRATFLLYSGSTTIFYKNHRKCKVFKIKVYVSFRFLRSRKEPECTRILAKWTNSLNREEV